MIEKMTSVVEGNEVVKNSSENLLDKKHVEEAIAKGTDVYNNKEIQLLPYDARNIDLPYLDEFLRKYPHFLREPEKYFNK